MKVWTAFCLNFIVCYILIKRLLDFTELHHTSMQIFEPFIWTFDESHSVLLISAILLLLFSDVPYLGREIPYQLIRMNRKIWVGGQIIYVIAATGIYMMSILLSTIIICGQQCFLGNVWSETAVKLAYSNAGTKLTLASSVRTLELSRPYQCMATIFILIFLYACILVFLLFVFRILISHVAGMTVGLLFHLYVVIINPEFLGEVIPFSTDKLYQLNVLAGWISPLRQATYHLHNFGYDKLPTIENSITCGIVILTILILLAMVGMRNYNFSFGGNEQ